MSINFLIVSIEGNIGSGKSTLLENLKKNSDENNNFIFLREPVDEWSKIKDENGVTILEKFYSDQDKYSFPFQMMAYISRLKLLKETLINAKNNLMNIKENNDPKKKFQIVVFTERSLLTDKMVFAKMLYDSGKIEHINYQIYLNWFDTFAQEFPINKQIYVKTNPEICYERINKRGREGEENITLDYLKSCDLYHENMMSYNSHDNHNNEQLVLDGNIDIYDNDDMLQKWINDIENFIKK